MSCVFKGACFAGSGQINGQAAYCTVSCDSCVFEIKFEEEVLIKKIISEEATRGLVAYGSRWM